MNGKDPFEELEADVSILKDNSEEFFKEEPEEEIKIDINEILKQTAGKRKMPRHLMRRTLVREQDEWNMNILPAAKDELWYRCGTKRQADLKRTRLYHARTYLIHVREAQYGLGYKNPLNDWSLSLEQRNNTWYVVARRIVAGEWIEEPPKME